MSFRSTSSPATRSSRVSFSFGGWKVCFSSLRPPNALTGFSRLVSPHLTPPGLEFFSLQMVLEICLSFGSQCASCGQANGRGEKWIHINGQLVLDTMIYVTTRMTKLIPKIDDSRRVVHGDSRGSNFLLTSLLRAYWFTLWLVGDAIKGGGGGGGGC